MTETTTARPPRVLVTEEIASAGLELLRERGFDVDVALGLDAAALRERAAGAAALIVRSATQVDADLLASAPHLQVVGRAGVGVDNVDVAAATARGVLVVNAPQSNTISAAEHTMALLLAEARNVAQADASLRAGRWDRKHLQGVELYGKTLGILGLGRIGSLVAERAAAFGMTLVAYDPFVSEERARQMGVDLVDTPEDVFARSDFLTVHLPRSPETEGLVNADSIAKMRDGVRILNVARGGIVDEAALADAIVSGKVAGAGIDVYASEPCTDSPLFSVPEAVVTPHLGASTEEAQDRAGMTIAEQVVAALSGEFVPYAVNVDVGRGVSDVVAAHLPVAEALGAFFAAYAGGTGDVLEVTHTGVVADHDTRVLTLAVLKGVFGSVSDEPVTFVNAPLLADERGLDVRETTSSRSDEFVSLITVSAVVAGRSYKVAGTLGGLRRQPRIVRVDEYEIDLPPTQHMAVISNDDSPGVIGHVGTVLGTAGVNIANMTVGRHVDGNALMGINFDSPIAPEVADAVRSRPGVLDARFLDLGPVHL
ncbi:MAG: phosphoglycerate dehydrogenase [Acidimicrobiia bacterium]|nr:phosphoglycerate dehydrogenase [Acidimicrobiia bacterium]